jgi:hypothetical protein
MSEPVQIVLGILFLAGIFVLTRYLVAWQIGATGRIIGDVSAPRGCRSHHCRWICAYAKQNPLRISEKLLRQSHRVHGDRKT